MGFLVHSELVELDSTQLDRWTYYIILFCQLTVFM